MGLSGDERREAQDAFRSGKETDFSLKTVRKHKERFARHQFIAIIPRSKFKWPFLMATLPKQAAIVEVSKQLGISRTQFAFW